MFYQDRYFVRLQVAGATSLERIYSWPAPGLFPETSRQVQVSPRAGDFERFRRLLPRANGILRRAFWGMSSFAKGIIADRSANEKMQIFVIHEIRKPLPARLFDPIPFLS